MRVDVNVNQRGPKFLLSDLPDDDEWVETTQHQDIAQRFLGVNTGDVLGVREIGGLLLGYRQYKDGISLLGAEKK